MRLPIVETIRSLREAPERFLDPVDALQLSAFLYGYAQVEARLAPILRDLAERFVGPSGAPAFERVYLLEDDAAGVRRLLDELESAVALADWSMPPARPESSALAPLIAAIDEGRPGMVMPRSSFFWLRAYCDGFVQGLEGIDAPAAAAERARFIAFERYVQDHFGAKAGWHRVLRVCSFDHHPRGMKDFLELWRRCGLAT